MAFVLSELDHKYFPTPWTHKSWVELFITSDRLLVLLMNESEVIGFCLFDKVVADSFAHLLKIMVLPSYRGKKLGKYLLQEAILRLDKYSCTHLFLEVEEENVAARNLYEDLGFKVVHRKKDFYGTNKAGIIMTRG